MAVEWARLKPQGAVELADRGIFLRGDGGCRVMLLHGLTGGRTELGYLAHWLRSRGRYHVSCPRLVNHGQPLGVLARTTSAQLYQSAKDAFFEARAAARAEGVPLVIGGLSLGANLSLMLAAEFPDDVAGAACLAPTFFFSSRRRHTRLQGDWSSDVCSSDLDDEEDEEDEELVPLLPLDAPGSVAAGSAAGSDGDVVSTEQPGRMRRLVSSPGSA